tara:strand:- start:608 stop:763 length:156 start_codon:yes stop_codon:yes gene_type:complete
MVTRYDERFNDATFTKMTKMTENKQVDDFFEKSRFSLPVDFLLIIDIWIKN